MQKKKLIVIAGPTGIGKTAYAIRLAQELEAEIIGADSRQVYRELNIGVAKQSQDELSAIPHHFVNHISIQDVYNAGKYEKEVVSFLETYFQRKDTAILCGGTGLYIDALCDGLDEFPEISSSVKLKVIEALTLKGLDFILEELRLNDPETFDIIDKSNVRRVLRAYEVFVESGLPYSSFVTKDAKQRPFEIRKIGLDMDRNQLYDRINQRVDAMIVNGLIEEAHSLLIHRDLKALETVGYSELFEYFDGKCTLEFAIDKIKQHSRNYAKRQWTWFRKDERYEWKTL
jgi:tRNA dimethylallyltransferase